MHFNFRSALQSYLTGQETFDLDHSKPGIPDIEELGELLREQVSNRSIEQLASMLPDLFDTVPSHQTYTNLIIYRFAVDFLLH